MKEEEKENEKLTTGTDEDDGDDDEEEIDEYSELNTNNNENKNKENSDQTSSKRDNDPEIVGLTIEQFYPLEQAKKLAQEILNYAGVNNNNPLEINVDYEFQRYVIRNDHCYTPLTSPSQSRTKLSIDSASSPTSTSSTSSQSLQKDLSSPTTTLNSNKSINNNLRQYSNKGKLKKGQQQQTKDLELNVKSEKHLKSYGKDGKYDEKKKDNLRKSIEEEEDDEEIEEEEYSDYTESSISESEDNDRDSDLDFDVNDRNGRKKKTISKRNKKTLSKIAKKRQSSIDNSAINSSVEEDKKSSNARTRTFHESKKSATSFPVKSNQSGIKSVQAIKAQLQQAQPQQQPKQQAMQISYNQRPQQAQQTQSQQLGVTRQPVTGSKAQIRSRQLSDSEKAEIQLQLLEQQNHSRNLVMQNKPIGENNRTGTKIVILKKEPKKSEGGFREISTLLGQGENNRTNLFITEIKPENSSVNNSNTRQTSLNQAKVHTTTKGFTPLGIESAAKNQLPFQISIQTHASTSELATEQLDLIDSIVKADMQKGNETMKNTINDNNIPQLVKMLESTEKAVLENQNISLPRIDVAGSSSTFTSNVEDIDISNAPLLEGAEDEIPEDIIQHVVELMEDKNLQDVIDSQVLSDVSIGQQQQSIVNLENTLPQSSSSISIISTEAFHQNPHTVQNMNLTTDTNSGQRDTINVLKEPIKIIKSDGRVITLPPIEAPTTRAKRRAQTQPATSTALTATAVGNATQIKLLNAIKSESRRNSNEQKTVSGRKRNSVSSQSTPKEDFDEETEEGDSDDDPNKLWCICRQPHNNRFMICCDICEDWFHGTCVNITKAVGREMENRGIEWTCPKCLKRDDSDIPHTAPQPQKKPIQRRITETFDKRPSEEMKNTVEIVRRASVTGTIKKIEKKKIETIQAKIETPKKNEIVGRRSGIFEVNKRGVEMQSKPTMTPQKSVQHFVIQEKSVLDSQNQSKMITIIEPVENDECIIKQEPNVTPPIILNQSLAPKTENLSCIVCKKSARANSIYCSDICIRHHAQNALISVSKVSKSTTSSLNAVTSPQPEDKKKKGPSSFEEALAKVSEPVLQNKKVERVYVYERKTGRILTGKDAPTTTNLKNWLHENPTFEVIQPGSPQALAIEKSKQKLKERSISNPTTPTSTTTTITIVKKISDQNRSPKPFLMSELGVRSVTPKLQKHSQQINLKTGPLSPPVSQQQQIQVKHIQKELNSHQKSHDSNQSSGSVTVTKVLKKQSSFEQKSQSLGSNNDSEPIRLNVKRTLKEQLISRLNEVKEGPKLLIEEVEEFAKNTEEEMFKLFNKDTGSKYKAKYRSLMFNIKDRKNETLFHKICSKIIEPKQLVRMSPEELASQELAQWRQNENKHQLEMIKKSELDLLSCAKNYVLKTHKGEEVIESKSVDRVNLDISIPVEDVVTILNNSSVSSTSEIMQESSDNKELNKSVLELTSEYESSLNASHLKEDSKTSPNNANDKNKKTVSKEKEREKDRERNKSKEKDRDREKDRERHKERDKDRHHKSSGKEKHKSRKRSRSRSKERRHKSPHKELKRERSVSSEKDKRRDSSSRKDRHDSKTSSLINPKSSKSKEKEKFSSTTSKTSKQHIPSQAATGEYNLIDKILESTKTVEEAANLAQKADEIKEKSSSANKVSSTNTTTSTATQGNPLTTAMNSPTGVVNSGNKSSTDGLSTSNNHSTKSNETSISSIDSDQEPSSTVIIASPPVDQYAKYTSDLASVIWNGNINMIDVATFQIMVQPISGVITELDKQLPMELDVVGRISPDTVWDYIGKIRKSPNKEIVLIRLLPACLSENMAYIALYSYLDKRKRLGVVKTSSPNIKDFYIMPLNSKKILPLVLQPVENTEFFEDENRPDLLVGIVIRIMGKRQPPTPLVTNPAKIMRKAENTGSAQSRSTTLEKDTFTPPNSPKIFTKKKSETKSIITAGKLPPRASEPMDVDIPTPPPKPKLPVEEDENEPYSPGGSSDDDVENLLPSVSTANAVAASLDPGEIQRRMEEINRQIEAQKIEIAGILSTTSEHVNIESNPSYAARKSPPPVLTPALAGISIPSNLQEILASIKSKPESAQQPPLPPPLPASSTSAAPPPPPIIGSIKNDKAIILNDDDDDDDDIEEYTPLPASAYKVPMKAIKPRTPPVSPDIAIPGLSPPRDSNSPSPAKTTSLSEEVSSLFASNNTHSKDNEMNTNIPVTPLVTSITQPLTTTTTPSTSTSRLAQLSEEELLSMVPDEIKINEIPKPPVPEEKTHMTSMKDVDMRVLEPPGVLRQSEKSSRWEAEPPPPGLEDEFI